MTIAPPAPPQDLEEVLISFSDALLRVQEGIPEAGLAHSCTLFWEVPVLSLEFLCHESRGEPVTRQPRDGEIFIDTRITIPRLPQVLYTQHVAPLRPLLRLVWGCAVHAAVAQDTRFAGVHLFWRKKGASWGYGGWSAPLPLEHLWPQADTLTLAVEQRLNVMASY